MKHEYRSSLGPKDPQVLEPVWLERTDRIWLADFQVSGEVAAARAAMACIGSRARRPAELRHRDHPADGHRAKLHDSRLAEAGPLGGEDAGAGPRSSEDQGQIPRRPDEAARGRAGAV